MNDLLNSLYPAFFKNSIDLFIGILLIVQLILMFWAIIDCSKRIFENNTIKLVWILVSLLLSPLGAIAYLIAGRNMGKK